MNATEHIEAVLDLTRRAQAVLDAGLEGIEAWARARCIKEGNMATVGHAHWISACPIATYVAEKLGLTTVHAVGQVTAVAAHPMGVDITSNGAHISLPIPRLLKLLLWDVDNSHMKYGEPVTALWLATAAKILRYQSEEPNRESQEASDANTDNAR